LKGNNTKQGQIGEKIAAEYLSKHGYFILATNWRFGKGEIDIIAKLSDIVAFVEVKMRSNSYFGEPESFVSKAKQKLLIKTANHFIRIKNIENECRFDIISITGTETELKIKHIIDAFKP
jgi:putative endonuclease